MKKIFNISTYPNVPKRISIKDAENSNMFLVIHWFHFIDRCVSFFKTIVSVNQSSSKNLYKLALLILFSITSNSVVFAQSQDTLTINGKILNAVNEPIANVAVSIEGSAAIPALTDKAGKFTINAGSGYEWINIQPSDTYKKQRVFLNNRKELIIYLSKEDISSGYDQLNILSQAITKRDIISSNSTLGIENIKKTQAVSIDQYMQGRVPGMFVTNRSGLPGSGALVLLRGIKSYNTSIHPLYVVDGIPITSFGYFNSSIDGYSYNPLLSINNLDVSSINVIKDPTVTAAYGSKASNGIVLIETIDPSVTQTTIEFDLRSGYSSAPSRYYPQLNAQNHKTLINEILTSSGMFEEKVRENYPELFLTPDEDDFINYQHNTNWQDIIFSDAMFTNLNVKVKGGDEIARYGLSFGYMNANGIIKNTGYDGYNLRFISLVNIFQWLKMNAGVSLNYSTSEMKESAKVAQTNPILTSLGKSPMLNPFQYDNEGLEIDYLAPVDNLGVSNPQAVIDNYSASNSNIHFLPSLGIEAALGKNVLLNSKVGITYNVLKESIFMPNRGMEHYYNNEAINVSKSTNNALSSFYNNSYLEYDKAFGKNHRLKSTTGVNIISNTYKLDIAIAKNAPENDQYRMLQNGANNLREIGGDNRNYNWLSFYEYINYNYRDKYLFSASVSLDGSSRLGRNANNTVKIADVPFGFFYGAGVGWRISNESFLINTYWLDELKFRLSYGSTGNDDIGELNAANYYGAIKYRETVGLFPATIPNDRLTFENVTQLNGGLDISLLGSRFSASIDAYQSVTSNVFTYVPIEVYFGYSQKPENSGEIQNTGIDLGIFTRIFDKPAFTWDIQMTLSSLKNEITDMKENMLVTQLEGAEIVNMPGQQVNSFYGYLFEGVFSNTLEAENADLVNERNTPFRAGDAIFSDLSGPDGIPDGVIDDYDKTVLGSSLPELFGGINNTFAYKRWRLDIFLQFVKGNEIYNYVRSQNENMKGLQNQSVHVLDRWQYEGHQTMIPRATWEDVQGNASFSSRWIEDGSYLRIKNVSLSYTIPENFMAFKNAQFYITGSNLFTFSDYLGYDPEFAHSHSQIDQGIDYGQIPNPRQFIIGIKLGL